METNDIIDVNLDAGMVVQLHGFRVEIVSPCVIRVPKRSWIGIQLAEKREKDVKQISKEKTLGHTVSPFSLIAFDGGCD